MNCPRCHHEFEVQSEEASGGSSFSSSGQHTGSSDLTPSLLSDQTRPRVRGKAREYSPAFEIAWKAYGRKEEKLRAYGEWIVQARKSGGENQLLPLILSALAWQGPIWAADGWKFAKYFERYLKAQKWNDERPPAPQAVPHRIDDRLSRSTSRKIAEINSYADKRPSADELAELRKAVSGGK